MRMISVQVHSWDYCNTCVCDAVMYSAKYMNR